MLSISCIHHVHVQRLDAMEEADFSSFSSSNDVICNDVTLPESIQKLLPVERDYHVCRLAVEEPSDSNGEVRFTATLRVSLRSEEEFLTWLQDFQRASYTTWRVKRTFYRSGRFIEFKKLYRCQHNTRIANPQTNSKRRVQSKNTNCEADMLVSVRRVHKVSRSKDMHLPQYPTKIVLNYVHNHTVFCAEALKFRDVSAEAAATLESLFKRKYGPTAAVEMLKYELQLKHGDDYPIYAADRSICPDVQFAYRLYMNVFQQEYGKASREEMIASLQDYTNQYNAEMGSACMAMDFQNDQLAVAICTPLMRRVHLHLKHAGEMAYMDASSNTGRHGCSVFLLLTHSCAGGLPLGVLITTSESESSIAAALELYTSILPEKCFGGRGLQGPKIFMTDDSTAEHSAIRRVFPTSTCLLCVFHVLQATWRWLWDNKNQIPKDQRPNHLLHLKRIINAESPSEMESLYQDSLQDTTVSEKFKKYLKGYMARKDMWAITLRSDVFIRGDNASNFAEAAMRVLKDKILQRTKVFSVPQLADFVCTFLQDHYRQRLVDVADGRLDYVVTSRFMPADISKDDIKQISSTDFEVLSRKDGTYHVNTLVGHCTCHRGKTGGPCKHQAAVVRHHGKSSTNFVPINDPEMRHLLHKIAADNSTAEGLRLACEDMIQRMEREPSLMIPAVKCFTGNYRRLKTSTSLCSAMYNFGKDQGAAAASLRCVRKLKKRSIERHRGGSSTGVQPTPTARRRAHVGRGGRRITSGRPLKACYSAEHGYAVQPSQSRSIMPIQV